MKIPYVDDDDSVMYGGDVLLDQLQSTNKQWFLIHGHAHVPHLTYASSSIFAPVVLSAGSVAAKTYQAKGGVARNQIHHISIALEKMEATGAQILGSVTSWTWAFENGWERASGTEVLPHKTGFGYRLDAMQTRDTIMSKAKSVAPRLLSWSEVLTDNPKLAYITPDDQASLVELLKAQGLRVELDEIGVLSKLEWPQ
jgi:hypothetical protein